MCSNSIVSSNKENLGRLIEEEGMVIKVPQVDDSTSGATQTSPLTEGSSFSGADSTASQLQNNKKNTKKRIRRNSRQASQARLQAKLDREDYNRRFKEAFKQGTVNLARLHDAAELHADPPKRFDESSHCIVARLNKKYRLDGTRRLSRSTLYRAIKQGKIGTSPPKRGPASKIPDVLLETVTTHAEVSQVGNGGELRGRDFKRLIGAAVIDTPYESKFTVESAWRKLRNEFPDRLGAAKQVSMEDARVQWTSHDNLQQWFDDAKKDLISTGLVRDQEVRDENGTLVSELDFRSEQVTRRIINMDETHHDLSITGDKGGPRSVVYHNPGLQRGCKRTVKASRHVTGVYATNAAGEALPPMFIFDSGAKLEKNFRVKVQWLQGLPVVTGRFGCPTQIEESSFCSVRTRGSMDDTLFIDYIERVVLPLYPNISKTAEFDPVTGKLLCGPVVLKVDSGPGRIVASEQSITKRAELLEKGLYILMGLPNATSVNQEMDVLYGAFKTATYARGEMIVVEKLKERGNLRMLQQRQLRDRTNEDSNNGAPPQAAASLSLSLGFNDLSTIVNGKDTDDVSLKPFDKCFTKERIIGSWKKVGFVPFTRNCMNDKKVRHELGQNQKNEVLEELKVKYDNLVALSREHGLNSGVFDATIPVACHAKRAADKDEQVKQLVEKKGAFSISAIWATCGTCIGNSSVILRAQKEQLAIDASKTASVSQTKIERQAKLLANAQRALQKYRLSSESLNDKDWGDIIRWVLPEAKADGLMKDLKKKHDIIAKLATLERDWTTYIPLPDAV